MDVRKSYLNKEVLSVLIVILCAIGFRLFLTFYNWPLTDAEEGTFALEAMHIAFKGEWPIFMYGQNYMGVAESYVGAGMYHLFGASIFSLRLGMLLFFSVFLVLVYLLGRSLYGHTVALISLIFLAGATDVTIARQMKAVGGVEEMFVSGTLCMLLATWLVLSARRPEPPKRWKRMLAYVGWGVAAGFGLWSHLLVVPFIFCSGLLLVIFCWRELLSIVGLTLVVGLVIGAWPLIIYNLHAPLGETTPMVFLHLYNYKSSTPTGLMFQLQKVINTFDYTLPLATGVLHIDAPDAKNMPLRVLLLQSIWSLVYLALLFLSLFFACKNARVYLIMRKRQGSLDSSSSYQLALEIARLMLVLSAILTIISFAASSNAALRPWSYRYLSGLTITNAVIFAPLVLFFSKYRLSRGHVIKYVSIVLTLFFIVVSVIGTVQNVQSMGRGNTRIEEQATLITGLKRLGIKNFYSGYWVCDRIIFQSQEELTCGVISDSLVPQKTRYAPYADIVSHDPNAAYVFTQGKDYHPDNVMNMLAHDERYQRTTIGVFIVFYLKGMPA